MRSINTILNIALSIALIFALAAIGLPRLSASAATPTPEPVEQQPQAPVCDASRTVDVSGTAVINVAPDRVLIQLGVQSNGISPKEVQRRNAAAISRVRAAIQKLGVKASDITSDNYIIEPIYEDYDALYIKGYRINNVVAITLRDVSKTSQVIAAALGAGANQVVNVDLYTSELRKYRDQARDMAMKAAAEKAQALAGAAGTQTGCVLSITENSWSSYNGWWSGRNQNQWAQNVVQNIAPAAGSAARARRPARQPAPRPACAIAPGPALSGRRRRRPEPATLPGQSGYCSRNSATSGARRGDPRRRKCPKRRTPRARAAAAKARGRA